MATARFITNLALRKLGVLGAGREARPVDATDTLAALQGLYTGWIAVGAFGRLYDRVPVGTQFVAQGHERIMRESPDTLDVILPELVSEGRFNDYGRTRTGYYGTVITITTTAGETVVDVKPGQPIGYVQPPRDGSPVVISDSISGNTATWLYDGTIKKWEQIELLQLDDEAPRSVADPQGLAACLAMEIADQYGNDISDVTARQAARYQMAITSRFGMRRDEVAGSYY